MQIGLIDMIQKTTSLMKFKRLKRRLRLTQFEAIGLLECLWLCCQANTPQGDLGRLSDGDIAAELEWDRTTPAELVEALVVEGWLDRDGDVHQPGIGWRLLVHDWPDHCPNYTKGNLVKRKMGFATLGGSLEALPRGRSPGDDPQGTHHGKHHQTKPNQTSWDKTPTGSIPTGGGKAADARDGHGSKPPSVRGDAESPESIRQMSAEVQIAKIASRLRGQGFTDEDEIRRRAIEEFNERQLAKATA